MFCLWLTSTSVPPAHPWVHLCDEFLSAGTSLSNSFFLSTVGDTGKAQPGSQVTGKAAVQWVQNSKEEAAECSCQHQLSVSCYRERLVLLLVLYGFRQKAFMCSFLIQVRKKKWLKYRMGGLPYSQSVLGRVQVPACKSLFSWALRTEGPVQQVHRWGSSTRIGACLHEDTLMIPL